MRLATESLTMPMSNEERAALRAVAAQHLGMDAAKLDEGSPLYRALDAMTAALVAELVRVRCGRLVALEHQRLERRQARRRRRRAAKAQGQETADG